MVKLAPKDFQKHSLTLFNAQKVEIERLAFVNKK